MNRFSLEVKVGIVVSITIILIIAFLFFLGQYNPFTKSYRINVIYNFAGGIELGSSVRVAGVKVGKVDQIKFFETGHKFNGEPVNIAIRLLIDRRAMHMIREDSKFYITNAGIIGEKYIEITAGSPGAKVVANEAFVRGLDPPRLDELIAEGYSMFEQVSKRLESMSPEDKEKLRSLFDNLVSLSQSLSDLGAKSSQFTGMAADTRKLVNDLDAIVGPIAPRSEEDRVALKRKVRTAGDTLDHLNSVSAKIDDTLEGVTKASLERTVRQILQQEGITINLGTKLGKPNYPPLPQAPSQDNK
jgi:phospholipid/cholesterol/gamma-HCH transport system substrate-binding protein